jgi:hypothetical protein
MLIAIGPFSSAPDNFTRSPYHFLGMDHLATAGYWLKFVHAA